MEEKEDSGVWMTKAVHSDKNPGRDLLLIVLFAFLMRIVAVLALDSGSFPVSLNEHWAHARNIYEGRGFAFNWYDLLDKPVVGSFMPPLYAAIAAGLMFLSGGSERTAVLLAQLLNVLLSTGIVYLVGRLGMADAKASGAALSDDRGSITPASRFPVRLMRSPGLLAAAFWSVYPPALGHTWRPETQTLEAFLLALLAFIVIKTFESRKETGGTPQRPRLLKSSILAGFSLGLLLLVRPSSGVLWAFWCITIILTVKPLRAAFAFVVLSSLVAAATISPWTIRNFRVHHCFVPIATNGGFNFYIGSNPEWEGRIPPLNRFFTRMGEEEKEKWRSMTEVERDRRLYRMGLEFWRRRPAQTLAAVGRKLISFIFFRPYLFAAYPGWLYVGFVLSYSILFVFFLISLPRSHGLPRALFLTAIGAVGLVACIYVVSMRFRATVEPFMAVMGMSSLATRIGRRMGGTRERPRGVGTERLASTRADR